MFKNKINLSSYASSSLLFFLSLILFIVLANEVIINTTLQDYTKYDTMLINKFGYIRGSVQRYSKLKLINSNKTKNIKKTINSTFKEITYYLDKYPEIVPEKFLISFYDKLNNLKESWKKIKKINTKENLIKESEKNWKIANTITNLMKKIAEKKLALINKLMTIFTLVSLVLVFILVIIVYYLVRSGLEKATITDPLTKLYNRLYFENQLNYLIEKYKRDNTPFSAFLFDIDYFKKINDTYGHQKGDEVLEKLASVVKSQIRSTDLAFRYGGEEFIILFPDTNLNQAQKIAKRIENIIKKEIRLNNTSVTISGGIGEYNIYLTKNEFLRKIDQALYKAKKEGRDRIVTI